MPETGGVDPYPGGGGQVTQEGENILAEWNVEGVVDPTEAINALLPYYGTMMDLGIQAMRQRQHEAPTAFQTWLREKESARQTEDLMREMEKRRWADYRSQQFAANRRMREAKAAEQMAGTARAAQGIPRHFDTAMGGDFHGGVPRAQYLAQAPMLPPSLTTGAMTPGSAVNVTQNVGGGAVPGSAFNAMLARGASMGGGGGYVPFATGFEAPTFESADIDEERERT